MKVIVTPSSTYTNCFEIDYDSETGRSGVLDTLMTNRASAIGYAICHFNAEIYRRRSEQKGAFKSYNFSTEELKEIVSRLREMEKQEKSK